MFTLGVILARAGSKGLPGKCVRPVRGRPLIEYTIDHALAARRLSAVVLSSDSAPAQDIARRRGVEIVERPAELATDTASVDAAARHAVEAWERRHERRVDAVALLYGNVPHRAPGALDHGIEHLARSGGSSVRSVAPIGKHHPDWLHRLDGDRMTQFRPNSISRRQDLEPLYYHDGALLVVTRQALFDALHTPGDGQAFLGPDRRAIILRPEDAVDVDEPFDLALAEAALRFRETQPGGAGLRVGARTIAAGQPAYIIAEAGVNHDGDPETALRLIDIAADADADAVKFQLFSADALATIVAPLADYQRGAFDGEPTGTRPPADQREMLRRLELRPRDWARLRAHCAARGIDFLVTPFGPDDVARLRELDVPAVKIASTDLDNPPLIRAAAALGKPLIVSTGAATEQEIDAAVARFESLGLRERLVLLHCVSCYPTPANAANLRAIGELHRRFGVPCGFSDHTALVESGAWAAAAGACVLEKHFTYDRAAAGPDHAMSLDAAGLREYVARVRACEAALGTGRLGMTPLEEPVRRVARRSVVAACDLPAGAQLTAERLAVKRPAGGIAPDQFDRLLGRRLKQAAPRDAQITWDMLA
jgi:N,N'-diacetyllegionaminate synthase